jgi:6-phosphogluconolactonase
MVKMPQAYGYGSFLFADTVEIRGQAHVDKHLTVKYYVESDSEALARRAAQHFAEMISEAVEDHGRARIAISGGKTPEAVFRLLAASSTTSLPLDKLDIYWVDERLVPPDHNDSNYRMVREAWLSHVPLQPSQIHRIQGELEPQTAADRYEEELRRSFKVAGNELPRFDLVALGMGADGHTASLFPYSEALQKRDRLAVACTMPQKDTWRVTLTWPVIDHARSVFFLVSGTEKAEILKEVLTGPHDPERLPSQLIWPTSGILTFILDKAAASLLPAIGGDGCGVLERER